MIGERIEVLERKKAQITFNAPPNGEPMPRFPGLFLPTAAHGRLADGTNLRFLPAVWILDAR